MVPSLDAVSNDPMSALSPIHRTVLFIRIGLGWSVERSAAAMGTSPDAVRLMQHRALERLREQLATAA